MGETLITSTKVIVQGTDDMLKFLEENKDKDVTIQIVIEGQTRNINLKKELTHFRPGYGAVLIAYSLNIKPGIYRSYYHGIESFVVERHKIKMKLSF